MIIANDATVKAGAFFPMTAKKVLRAQTIAMENRIPTLYLVDSAGVFLPLQEDVFPDTDDFGRVFRNNAVMSSLGIPQITAIMGMCVAGGAYLPVMTDTCFDDGGQRIIPGWTSTGAGGHRSESLPPRSWVGPAMHAEISGTVDFKEANDAVCIARLRSLVARLGHAAPARFDRIAYDGSMDAPKYSAEDLLGILNPDPAAVTHSYDMHAVIARIVDGSANSTSTRRISVATVLCGYARIGGLAVGIVANQKMNQIRRRPGPAGEKHMEFGGVIYTESAQKAARFIMDCNQNLIPLIFLHDVNGFMVGKDAEW